VTTEIGKFHKIGKAVIGDSQNGTTSKNIILPTMG